MTMMIKQPKLSRAQLTRMSTRKIRDLLPGRRLDFGNHHDGSANVCLMEAVAYVAGEKLSDSPKCACPILTSMGIGINDSTDHAGRQRLIAAIPALVGSRTSSKRTLFKRVRRTAELNLDALIERLENDGYFNRSSRGIGGPSRSELRIFRSLRGFKGKALSLRSLDWVIETLWILMQDENWIAGECVWDGEVGDLHVLLTHLKSVWDSSKGISFEHYAKVMGAFDIGIVPGERQPDAFVEIATQRA